MLSAPDFKTARKIVRNKEILIGLVSREVFERSCLTVGLQQGLDERTMRRAIALIAPTPVALKTKPTPKLPKPRTFAEYKQQYDQKYQADLKKRCRAVIKICLADPRFGNDDRWVRRAAMQYAERDQLSPAAMSVEISKVLRWIGRGK
ncbi:hypothetical protein FHS21_002808 [Phyllobacterium trifolii]|uniref:Uncharacterized protein n=1 Tax=Phyllobacterium trifolii TaxID=300193 RepID=A0A839U917_9HYPH|nr:hypothetical protein [Phyllobacterium trifolii]MBB3146393.1 hypothetical protein [Phyllobacterium trifolii]